MGNGTVAIDTFMEKGNIYAFPKNRGIGRNRAIANSAKTYGMCRPACMPRVCSSLNALNAYLLTRTSNCTPRIPQISQILKFISICGIRGVFCFKGNDVEMNKSDRRRYI